MKKACMFPLYFALGCYDFVYDKGEAFVKWANRQELRYKILIWSLAFLIFCIFAEWLATGSKDWTDVLRALLTPVIAVGALLVSWQQLKIKNQEKAQFDFDRRWQTFRKVQENFVYMADVFAGVKEGRFQISSQHFAAANKEVLWLFGDEEYQVLESSVSDLISLSLGIDSKPKEEREQLVQLLYKYQIQFYEMCKPKLIGRPTDF